MIVAEVSRTDGPFQNPENFNKYNLFSKLSYDISPASTLSLAVSSYGGDWRGSGQIPSREVNAGRLDFFGAIDPTEGGNSARHNVYVSYQLRPDSKSELQAMAYYSRYTLKIISNFTLFSRDPESGDGIEQGDERNIVGLRAHPGACPTGTRAQASESGNFIGCEDVNFSPGYPINVQARATLYF